jgi:hypothetical protein
MYYPFAQTQHPVNNFSAHLVKFLQNFGHLCQMKRLVWLAKLKMEVRNEIVRHKAQAQVHN